MVSKQSQNPIGLNTNKGKIAAHARFEPPTLITSETDSFSFITLKWQAAWWTFNGAGKSASHANFPFKSKHPFQIALINSY